MKNYAKFCKLEINDKRYQLNLTEGGLDGSNILNKIFSIVRFIAPLGVLFCTAEILLLDYLTFLTPFSVAYPFMICSAFTLGCMFPHTNFGNIYNSICKNFVYKQKIKEFYDEMRELELQKVKKGKYTDEQQSKKANKILKYFEKQTFKFNRLSKSYYKKQQKKGYLDGIKDLALETLETRQETIDKFIFHNAKLLIELAPDKKSFILERFNYRLKTIKDNEPYYDEFIWTAETGENLIKNDCIDKNETSNYIQSLQELFGFEKKDTTPKFEKLKEEPKKIEKTIEPTKSSIYKTKEIQEIFLEKK